MFSSKFENLPARSTKINNNSDRCATFFRPLYEKESRRDKKLNYNARLYKRLITETEEHIHNITKMGLGERAKIIKLKWFNFMRNAADKIDLTVFAKRTDIPKVVIDFDKNLKNTLITTDPRAAPAYSMMRKSFF